MFEATTADRRDSGFRSGIALRRFILGGIAAASLCTAGCNIIAPLGAMAENYRRTSTRTVAPEYTGLEGKRWAVIVIADRIIQSDLPDLVPYLTAKITDRLAAPAQQQKIGAAGYIPAGTLLRYLYDHPQWLAMQRTELAKDLGVDTLIVVEVVEAQLHSPGNQYLWAGLVTGNVGIVQADSTNDDFAFHKSVRVSFPDKDGFGPNDMTTEQVSTALASRFIDRVTWLFYSHEEPYYPKY